MAELTGTIKISLALAAVLAIAAPVWSQEADRGFEEKAQADPRNYP